MKVISYARGELFFSEGEAGDFMCEILSGKVGIFCGYGTEREKKLATMAEGQFFGEMAIIDAMPRSATALALEGCEVLVVRAGEFSEYLAQNPEKSVEMMKNLSRRLRGLTVDFMEACKSISDTMDSGGKHDKSLMARLRRFADIYNEGCKAINEANMDPRMLGAIYSDFQTWY